MEQHPAKTRHQAAASVFSRRQWLYPIFCFDTSWFVSSMGTGVIAQLLANFPYPAQWLHNLAYCFWILVIVLCTFYMTLGLARCVCFPRISRDSLKDFKQCSYLGAIPITLDTITIGICIFCPDHVGAIWAAYTLYWICIAMSIAVGCVVVFITCTYQEPLELRHVTAVWMLSFIPFIVTSSTGAELLPFFGSVNQVILLVVSFLSWSLGVTMCFIIMAIYFWRLTRHSLPSRDTIASCFIPMGPMGLGSFAIQNLAVGLGALIESQTFMLHRTPPSIKPVVVISAAAEAINWMGLLVALVLVAVSTFWFFEAICSLIIRLPKRFNAGFWAVVFPTGAYASALGRLALDLNNDGFKIWGSICTIVTVLLWLGCAIMAFYKGILCRELFWSAEVNTRNEASLRVTIPEPYGNNEDHRGESGMDGDKIWDDAAYNC